MEVRMKRYRVVDLATTDAGGSPGHAWRVGGRFDVTKIVCDGRTEAKVEVYRSATSTAILFQDWRPWDDFSVQGLRTLVATIEAEHKE